MLSALPARIVSTLESICTRYGPVAENGLAGSETSITRIDADWESHFGEPDCQTLFDPPFCALNLQDLMEYYEILRIRAPQNTFNLRNYGFPNLR